MNDDLRSRLHALGDEDDLNRPLEDLDVVLRRTHRHRAGRMLAVSVTAVLVVAATATAVPRLSAEPGPASGTTPTIDPGAPAACGQTSDEIRAGDGIAPSGDTPASGTDLWVVGATASDAAASAQGNTWVVTVRLAVGEALAASVPTVPEGWTIGSQVVLLQGDRVVAVLDDHEDMPLETAQRVAVDAVPQPFPMTATYEGEFVWCATAEKGAVPVGSYELVTSTTFGWTVAGSNGWVARATSAGISVSAVDVPTAAPSAPSLACGGDDDELAALADPQQNPSPVRLSVEDPTTTRDADDTLDLPVTLTNDSPDGLVVDVRTPTVVVTRDGTIVGGLDHTDDGTTAIGLEPGGEQTIQAPSELGRCDTGDAPRTGLDEGEYEYWIVVPLTPQADADTAAPGTTTWTAAAGPYPLTITAPHPHPHSEAP
ncbi:hypothetical protein [Cellulomonas composti]|uniref:Uncharacterized protein n=1 Tax=Cellulomonas composti TaxID=266130 RepID=A0A511JCY2_9CELL|nr:hypothetical protein [Cellulomonas composti]GEL95806.1 hypothetical protein CCO02nite_24640 [Cellulomonas composti]